MDLLKEFTQLPASHIKGLLNVKPPKTIRVNTLKTSKEELINLLTNKGFVIEQHPLYDNALIIVNEPFSAGATTEYLAGYYSLQDAASMLAVSELGVKDNELILDLTSAPGLKTTHISELMNNTGVVIAVDNNKKRLKSVRFNAERLGCNNIIGLNIDGRRVKELGLVFDRVLLDAPCSALGTIHKNPELLNKQLSFKRLVSLQKSLIESAISVLKPGGILVYSVCTINPAECEGVVEHAVNQGLRLVDTLNNKGVDGLISKVKRYYPHLHKSQGFFIARLMK